MKYLSVCSGIEAATVAWHPLGFVPVAFSEIESFPCAVLGHHYPQVPNLGDMTKFKEWPDYAIQLVVGGTPCQSFSVAGLRKGLADPRGNLALVFLAIIDRYRPRWVVWENVPGVHSSWSDVAVRDQTEKCGEVESSVRKLALEAGLDGETIDSCGGFEEADQSNDFDCFLAGLEQLGYGVASTVLDAQFFGVAQRRERVFVVGHIGGEWQRAAAVLFERAGLCGHPAPRREKREGVAPTISARTQGGGGLGTDFDCDGGLDESSVTATLTKNYATHHGRSAGNNGGVAENQLIPTAIRTANTNANGHGISENLAHTLDGVQGQAIAFSAKDSGADAQTELSPTLRALNHDQSHANSGWSVAVAHALKADGFDASEDGTGRGTPLVPEICGTLSDGAHMGGGLNGQDAYTGRIIPANQPMPERGSNGEIGQRDRDAAADASRRFL